MFTPGYENMSFKNANTLLQSDGTSDQSAARYDGFCGKASAFKPAPEAGTWFNAYFEMLLKNASPALA
jgi:cellulose 1,4-beta-cellobiosidase